MGRRLRVCYLVAYFHPFESGAERQALAQGAELAHRGHAVHVVTHAMPGVPRDEMVRGIAVHRWIQSSRRGPLFAATFVTGALCALRRLRGEVDLIHTHQALWEAVASGLARRVGWLRDVPTIVQPASSGYYGEAQELRRLKGSGLLRRLILANDAFVAISADIEREWLALGVDAARLTRIASGVDGRHFAPGPSTLEPELPPRPRIVFTGRLHPQKNLDILLDAWPRVVAATGAHLVLVGQGPERERLEAKAESLGIGGHVCFLGALPDVAEALRAADVFALPSVAEGMSNSLLEAMATALPCVASDIGGNQDLLAGGEAGLLVPSPTPDAWAAALIGLVESPSLRERMGDAARRRIDEGYTLERIIDRYERLYGQLLSTCVRRRPGLRNDEGPGSPGPDDAATDRRG